MASLSNFTQTISKNFQKNPVLASTLAAVLLIAIGFTTWQLWPKSAQTVVANQTSGSASSSVSMSFLSSNSSLSSSISQNNSSNSAASAGNFSPSMIEGLGAKSEASSSLQANSAMSTSGEITHGGETQSPEQKPSLIGGKVQKIENLGLMKQGDENWDYYTAGKFEDGKYKDFERIIWVEKKFREFIYVAATKGRVDFVFDLNSTYKNVIEMKTELTENKFSFDLVDSDLTQIIDLYGDLALHWGNHLEILDPQTDLSKYQKLDSKDARYRFYFDSSCEEGKFAIDLKNNEFCGGESGVLVQDKSGLLAKYNLSFDQFVNDFEAGNTTEIPKLKLTKEQISQNGNFYSGWATFFPEIFGSRGIGIVKNITSNDLEKIASFASTDLFVLKDKKHPLYQAQYELRVGHYTKEKGQNGKTTFENTNGKAAPSFDEYVAKNPLLIFPDRWQRWVILGENEYKFPLGGAKPVLYFYPQKEIQVEVKFTTEMDLDVQIPSYSETNGWKILAKPNGELTDLQPEKTDCRQFDGQTFGQEYAREACEKNSYPYIYWAGGSKEKNYPKKEKINSGVVVEKENLEKVLTEKLEFMGLNEQEKADFMEYWLAKMQKQNKKYYRLSFLQNQELDELFPMQVSPKPQTLIRVFLDWEGLDEKVQIPAQNLQKGERNGFTVVEWGGLRR